MADITVARQFKEHVMAMDSDGEFTQIEVPYVVFGTDEEEKALAAVHGEAPEEWEGLPIESLEISSREGNEAFTVSVIYKNRASSTSSSKEKEEDEPTVSFDCGGGTRHMTHSYHQKIAYGSKKAGGASQTPTIHMMVASKKPKMTLKNGPAKAAMIRSCGGHKGSFSPLLVVGLSEGSSCGNIT